MPRSGLVLGPFGTGFSQSMAVEVFLSVLVFFAALYIAATQYEICFGRLSEVRGQVYISFDVNQSRMIVRCRSTP
jgi:hypothetical protein